PVELLRFIPAMRDWTVDELVGLLGPPPAGVAGNGAGEIAPSMPEKVPVHLLARLHEEAEDRSKQSYAFVAACLASGLSDAETLALALEHQPPCEQYGERAAVEVGRVLR